MPMLVRTRLSVMMLLFYASLGSWAVTAATYFKTPVSEGGLELTNWQTGLLYSTFAIGGLLALPLVGLLADRLFRAERVFAIAAVVCAGILFATSAWCHHAQLTLADESAAESIKPLVFPVLFVLLLVYSFFLQIGLPLATVLCLRNLPDPSHQFSRTRLWGTVGWIVVGVLMPNLVVVLSSQQFFLAGCLALVCGVYSWWLPPTRPKGQGRTLGEAFGLPALALLKERSFAVYLLVGFVLSVTNQFYGVYGHPFLTSRHFEHAERWMTVGQVVEVGCMFVIPLLRPAHNMKWLMLAGAVGGALRGFALAYGPDWLLIGLGVPMHGWQFAFYFVVAATYIDRQAPSHLRSSTQAIAAFVGGGLGPLVGNQFAVAVLPHGQVIADTEWTTFWLYPMGLCAVASLVFLVGFRTPEVAGVAREEFVETEIPVAQA